MIQTTQSITEDLKCIGCGYNLRGLTPEKVCPECATPIRQSLVRNLLRFADPSWLSKIRLGTALILFVQFDFAFAVLLANIRVAQLALLWIGAGLALVSSIRRH